ncbi:MAG TPA: helix-turn-helix domain-containing protein [Xanthomonadales bacterium]|nr:helix-turn-helix domain-containing protein [Xanthomonadales bacterium]
MNYTQLTQEERYQIFILKKAEYSQAQIAELLERDKSTVSRELHRNRALRGYRPWLAHPVTQCHFCRHTGGAGIRHLTAASCGFLNTGMN